MSEESDKKMIEELGKKKSDKLKNWNTLYKFLIVTVLLMGVFWLVLGYLSFSQAPIETTLTLKLRLLFTISLFSIGSLGLAGNFYLQRKENMFIIKKVEEGVDYFSAESMCSEYRNNTSIFSRLTQPFPEVTHE